MKDTEQQPGSESARADREPPRTDWGAPDDASPSPESAVDGGSESSSSPERAVDGRGEPSSSPEPAVDEGRESSSSPAPAVDGGRESSASPEPAVDAGGDAAADPSSSPEPEAGARAEVPVDADAGGVEGSGAGTDGQPPEPEPVKPPGAVEGEPPQVEAPAAATPNSPGWQSTPGPVRGAAPGAAPSASVLEVRELDWDAVRSAVADPPMGERAERIIARMEERLEGGGPLGLAFEEYAAGPADRAIQVGQDWPLDEVWFVGDVHGDLLALEAALQHIDRSGGGSGARLVFLGDLFDDGVHAAQVVLRIFELLLDGPLRLTILAGNHDEALAFADGRFQSSVLPSDFTDWLNAHADDPLAARLGHVIIRFFARAPRALFFPDGLLVAHAGVPHTDLHEELAREGNWNDPRVLQDFVWLRAHPRARKRIPNRTTRGSEFGRDDFTAFCGVATKLGRPVERMLRGHDHVEERFAVYPAWTANPVLTINTLSHRLPREVFGDYERVPVVAKWVRGELPEVRRLFVPAQLIRDVYPEPGGEGGEGGEEMAG